MILPCKCAHLFQDKEYGPGRRVHNPCKTPSGPGGRCTVCADVKVLARTDK